MLITAGTTNRRGKCLNVVSCTYRLSQSPLSDSNYCVLGYNCHGRNDPQYAWLDPYTTKTKQEGEQLIDGTCVGLSQCVEINSCPWCR